MESVYSKGMVTCWTVLVGGMTAVLTAGFEEEETMGWA